MDATGSQVLTAVIRVLRADGGLLETFFFFKKVSKHTTQTQNSTIYLFYGDNSKIDLKFIKTDLLKLWITGGPKMRNGFQVYWSNTEIWWNTAT